MNKNNYLNFILTAMLLAVIIIGIALVKSVDLLRSRNETIISQLNDLNGRVDNLERKIVNLQFAAPLDNASQVSKKDAESVANREFFDPDSVSGDRIIVAISSETKNMNSLVNNEAFVSDIWGYTYDSLAERNFAKPEIFEPKLAESWSLSEDKLVYTINLRRGILWHDFTDPVSGKEWRDVEVNAADFKFYLDVVKNPDTDCAPIRTYLQDLERIEVIDKYKFKVHWTRPYFLSESMTLGLSPLPRHLYHAYDGPFDGKRFNDDHERNRLVVGCGPYRFDRWDKGQRIILSRWEKYFGRNLGIEPPITHRVFEVIKHKNTQLQSLRSNEQKAIDMMGLTPEQWTNSSSGPEFGEDGHLRKVTYPARSYFYIGYNLKSPLFKDKVVRRALTHLVNRERILNEVYYGLGRIITGNFFIDSVYYDHSIKPYAYDIEKAKSLLGEAGWRDSDDDGILDKDGRKFEFSILQVADHPIQQRMLPIIKEDFAKAGIVMNISTLEWSVYVQKLEQKSFEACTLGWRMGFESDPYQIWHSSQADQPASSNHIGFKNAEADRLIEEIRVTFDLEKRIQLCHAFHRLLHEEQPYTFLFCPDSLLALHRRYRNARVFPSGVNSNIFWTPLAEQKPLP